MTTIIRWILAVPLIVFGVYVACLNDYIFFVGLTTKKKVGSWIPVIGGVSATAGMLLQPIPAISTLWWVPLIVDGGAAPGLTYTFVILCFVKRKKPPPGVKEH